jgi:diguanylate cyclase (GGDEF)-like protein
MLTVRLGHRLKSQPGTLTRGGPVVGWQLAVMFNGIIAFCYAGIASLITVGLFRTQQLSSNSPAMATAAIFYSCAVHHGHHASLLLWAFSSQGSGQDSLAVRAVFDGWHTVAIDGVGAVVAVTYLALRRNDNALLNTPQMFDDRVRLAAERALRDLAFADVLTGIPNRAAFQVLADDLVDDDAPVAVLFLDLDGFKGINDRFGHDVGDRVLRDVAQAIAAVLGADEHVFRLGGDELIVVGVEQGGVTVDDFRNRVQGAVARPVATRDGALSVGASCGLAVGAARDLGALLREADQDMYRIKTERRSGQPDRRPPDAVVWT